ncbi:hypothetical protein ACWEPL_29580 [Nonomuraea sp. NPDC004186]
MATVVLPRSDARLIREELEAAFIDTPECSVRYVIDEHAGRYSWGADGGPFYEVALFLAQSTVDGLLAATTLKLFEKFQGRHKKYGRKPADDFSLLFNLDREGAISFARWMIWSRYSRLAAESGEDLPGPDDPLELMSESYAAQDDTWTIILRDHRGARYKVVLINQQGLPLMQVIERELP